MRYDVDALSRAIDLAGKAPDAILFVCDNRFFFVLVPSHHIHKTRFNASLAARAFIKMNLNVRAHAPSKTEFL
jgi:hypothetical protein